MLGKLEFFVVYERFAANEIREKNIVFVVLNLGNFFGK